MPTASRASSRKTPAVHGGAICRSCWTKPKASCAVTWRARTSNGNTSQSDKEVLCIFHGPHAYISPSWYVQQHDVPTWNYAAVHVYGIPTSHGCRRAETDRVRHDREIRIAHAAAVDACRFRKRRSMRMLKAIVGFTIAITRVEAKFKLGQNRSPEDRAGTVRGLAHQIICRAWNWRSSRAQQLGM